MEQSTRPDVGTSVSNKIEFKHSFSFSALKPFILMLFSCCFGVFLLIKANTFPSDCIIMSSISYLFGSIFILPSLYLFFSLYQILLKPNPASLFFDTSDAFDQYSV